MAATILSSRRLAAFPVLLRPQTTQPQVSIDHMSKELPDCAMVPHKSAVVVDPRFAVSFYLPGSATLVCQPLLHEPCTSVGVSNRTNVVADVVLVT